MFLKNEHLERDAQCARAEIDGHMKAFFRLASLDHNDERVLELLQNS